MQLLFVSQKGSGFQKYIHFCFSSFYHYVLNCSLKVCLWCPDINYMSQLCSLVITRMFYVERICLYIINCIANDQRMAYPKTWTGSVLGITISDDCFSYSNHSIPPFCMDIPSVFQKVHVQLYSMMILHVILLSRVMGLQWYVIFFQISIFYSELSTKKSLFFYGLTKYNTTTDKCCILIGPIKKNLI